MRQKYGNIIKVERMRKEMAPEVLANILLLSDETLSQVETGNAELSDSRLNICANIFHISKDAMLSGVRRVAISDAELREALIELTEKVERLLGQKEMQPEAEKNRDMNIANVKM